ncbi:MAG: tetratricopeptide repeat protein [Candidatus Fermentibacteraceae bacterium]|nr:tetratricopeptide repeat protein [Candidatus Fermentibacteraceae bacterium]
MGREIEVLRISSMMRSVDCRLLTLSGPGGTGKTRLSIRIANELSHMYGDGAFFVPLAELERNESIASRIALVIGFTPEGSGSLDDQLAEHLSRREILLVLDNFEHLTDQAGTVGTLLERTDRLNILVTSRQRLRLRAEWVFEVPGMSLSEEGETDGDSDSVELFARTAKRIYGLDIAHGERKKVEGICRTVEGSPLAIELAASMCGILSLSEIAEQVMDPLSMESVMRDHPDRHSSLEAVFSFSWNLLESSHKSALCLLTVFKGGFDRRAAEFVCGIGIQVLLALRDRSLIWQLQEGYFGIHGTIKYFAEKRTDVMEDPAAVRSAHSEYYLNLLASRENDLVRGDRIGALADLERDLENIRAAWTCAVRYGRTDLLRGCLRGFVMLMAVKGQFREVYGVLEDTIEALDEKDAEVLLMAELLGHLGWAGSHILPLDSCIPPLERSLELYRSGGDDKGLAYGLNNFANVLNVKGEDERAESLYNESLEISRSIGDLLGMSATINNLGILAERRSDLDRAEELYRESAEICGRLGNQHGESMSLTNLSTIIRDKGDLRGSMELLDRALSIQRSIGDDFNTSLICCYMAEIMIAEGRPEEAEKVLHRILSCLEAQGHIWWVTWVHLLLTVAALERGDPESARASFSRSVELFDAHRWSQHLPEMMAVSAVFLSESGRPDEAMETAAAALQGGMLSSYLKGKVQRVLGKPASLHGTESESVDVDSLITLLRSVISGKSP